MGVGLLTEPLKFWSVTTLIKLGMGTSDALVNWAVNTTADYALDNLGVLAPLVGEDRAGAKELVTRARYRSSGKAAARGSELHAAAEKMALGVAPEVSEEIVPYAEQYLRFLNERGPEFLLSEAPVYNVSKFYAGTLDGVMKLDGQRVVFDIKTTNVLPGTLTDSGRPKSRPPYPEVALQLCAYRRAEEVGVLKEQRYASGSRYYLYDPDVEHAKMPETDGAVCIVICPTAYEVVPVRTDDEVFRAFLAARECARFNVDVSKRVFGPPLGAPNPQGALL